jgi:asparagine synthase (glutamine-hydrolysing)
MCGLAGVFTLPGFAPHEGAAGELLRVLAHRGPDDRGVLRRPCAGGEMLLVHRRLSILGLGEQGHQPMSSADGRLHLVFNGEIYNYVELRRELAALGHEFHSGTDTEVLLAAHARWGAAALDRLVGMFAYAVLDTADETLFLARDPFGIKPLYHASVAGGLAFASEPGALLALPGVDRRAEPQRAYDYLRFGITDHGAATLFAAVRQLPAGHHATVRLRDGARVEPVPYWSAAPGPTLEIGFGEAAARLRELLLESISLHLRSDVPVGAALSGGIDSSSIVAMMRHLEPGLDLHTISYVADDPALSEERWIDLAAGAAGAAVHKTRATPDELMRDLDALISVQGEPFGSTSIYAQYRVFQLAAARGLKVMLDGQGADEIFAGYRPYVASRAASLLRQGRFGDAWALARAARRRGSHGAVELLAHTAGSLVPPGGQEVLRRLSGQAAAPAWLRMGWFAERGVHTAPPGYEGGRDVLRAQLVDSLTRMSVPHLLRYEDRNSMAFSIESRVPFLTPALVSFVLALPERHLVAPDGTSKAVLRAAMRGLVPDAILDRRDKIGFATPEHRWAPALDPLARTALSGARTRGLPMLDLDRAEREWSAVAAGRRPYHLATWRWINLARWAELFDVRFE